MAACQSLVLHRYYAFEEGLEAAGVEYLTLPAVAGVSSDHPASWVRYARKLCEGHRFDQAWIWITHNDYHADLFNWLAEIAPVRLGIVMESLEHSPEELAAYVKLPGRRERVLTLLRHLTGLLAFDVADAESVRRELPLRTMWCPPVVPERCVRSRIELPCPGPAVFHGTLYSPERQAYLQLPELQSLISQPRLPEQDTPWPAEFDRLQQETMRQLCRPGGATSERLSLYLTQLRRVRRELFGLWLKGLDSAYATVNLPSVFKGYAGRVVESMAAGRPVISWDPPESRTRSLFAPEEEILLFDRHRPAELQRHILRLQRDPDFASAIAERARQKVLRHHTAEVRVRQILDWVEKETAPDLGEARCEVEAASGSAGLVDQVITLTRTAREAAQAGQLEPCLQTLERAIELDSGALAALKLRGDVCARAGRLAEATAAYQQILTRAPNDAPALYALSFTLEQGGKWSEAFAVYDQLQRLVPKDRVLAERVERLRLAYAEVLIRQQQFVEALGQLHGVIRLNPKNARAWVRGGQLALSRPDFLEVALEWTAEALDHHPPVYGLLEHRAEALLLSGQTEPACGLWEQVWSSGRQPRALAALIVSCLATGRAATPFSPEAVDSMAVSRAFIGWYQKLIAWRARETLERLNASREALREVLPEAAEMLALALEEVPAGGDGEQKSESMGAANRSVAGAVTPLAAAEPASLPVLL